MGEGTVLFLQSRKVWVLFWQLRRVGYAVEMCICFFKSGDECKTELSDSFIPYIAVWITGVHHSNWSFSPFQTYLS